MDGETDTDTVAEFARQARIFCAWAERESTEAEEPVLEALMMITTVYLAGLRLPKAGELEEDSAEEVEDGVATGTPYDTLYKNAAKVGVGYYSDLFDPLPVPADDTPGVADLPDDIADIYGDLMKGLRDYDAGKRENAIFAWTSGLYSHWGRHATSAMRVLHATLAADHSRLIL